VIYDRAIFANMGGVSFLIPTSFLLLLDGVCFTYSGTELQLQCTKFHNGVRDLSHC